MTPRRTAAAALLLSVACASTALAAPRPGAWTGFATDGVATTGTLPGPLGSPYGRTPGTCPLSSAAEGNAAQQNFPVHQYGQTTGGNRC